MAKLVGLTGGIGSGKSTVAALFVRLGVPSVDTDHISRQLTAPGGVAMPTILTHFGNKMIAADGGLDRSAMRSVVFSDPAARSRLEAILHPLISEDVARQVQSLRAHPYVLLEVPLLFESMRYRKSLLATIVVDCSRRLQIERVVQRSHLQHAEVQRIIDAQLPRAVRLQLADYVVCNSAAEPQLKSTVAALHAILANRCR